MPTSATTRPATTQTTTQTTTETADRPAVLIPIKSFELAKGRLAAAIEPVRRAELARQMATTVINAAGSIPVWIVCGDHGVADFARARGAQVIWNAPRGLNRAVTDGTRTLAARGFTRAVIAHADLPLATDLEFLAPPDAGDTVFLVPDRRNDGSNVLSIPLGRGFEFHYGPGSARAHRNEAARRGLPLEEVVDADLGWDVDVPEDLDAVHSPAAHITAAATIPATNVPDPSEEPS